MIQPKICIIGGGASGLLVSYYLKKKGFSNITVLEKENRIGGMCYTLGIEGFSFDLGANYITPAYDNVLAIAREVGAKIVPSPTRISLDIQSGNFQSTLASVTEGENIIDFSVAAMKYSFEVLKYHDFISRPGFAGLTEEKYKELSLPFLTWLQNKGLLSLSKLFEIPLTVFGYGRLDEIPTIYALKYLHFRNFVLLLELGLGMGNGWPKRFSEGYQRFLERISWGVNVRYNVNVEKVDRENGVKVFISGEKSFEEYDMVIVACPPDQALGFLNASPEEKQIFSKVNYNLYRISACETKNIPNHLIDEIPFPSMGHPWGMAKIYKDSNICLFYSCYTEGMSDEELDRHIIEDVNSFGGSVEKFLLRQKWKKFFPHLKSEDMAAGLFDKVEEIQGQNNTFYVGGFFSFELVETIAGYSKKLADKVWKRYS